MVHDRPHDPTVARRTFLRSGLSCLGGLALGSLFGGELLADEPRGAVSPLHLPARAKRVIFLYMAGGPSQLETFDYKPKLDALDGQPMPESFTRGQPIAQLQGQELKVQGHLCKFAQAGESGQWVSDFLPWQSKMVDDLAIIRSMVTEQINHDPAHTFMNTGTAINGRPSMGSWITYGLGSANRDLPSYVVMTSVGGRNPQPLASRQWSAGFLPSRFQGVELSSSGAPVHYLENPPGVTRGRQEDVVRAVNALDRMRHDQVGDPEIAARIAQMETAFRMQRSVPELADMRDEPQSILDLYGVDRPGDGSFASNCLLARRMVERGVRFVQLYHRGWDHHDGLVKHMTTCCRLTDQPTYALVQDLKQRGLLEDTLVIWGGEFGRTPMFQTKGNGEAGRDHHIKGFTMWLAGAGIKPGTSHGATDELGYYAAENPVHVRDLHATVLHLLGIDHERFSVKFKGLDTRLTGVERARPVHAILA